MRSGKQKLEKDSTWIKCNKIKKTYLFKNREVTLGKPSFVPYKQGHRSLETEGGQYCFMLCED